MMDQIKNEDLICKNCGGISVKNYCSDCGEKVYHDHHKTIGHLLEEAVHFITHLDGSIFKTARAVFFKPGQLSLDYCNGVRRKYFKPLSFFLICVVLYLLFPMFEGLNMRGETYANKKYRFTWVALPIITKKAENKNVTQAEIIKKYNELSPKISKLFLLALLPMLAMLLFILFFRQRQFFFDHYIMATEFASFWLTVKFLLLPTIMLLGTLIEPTIVKYFSDGNWVLWQSINAIFMVVAAISFKRFYGQNWAWSIIKAVLFVVIFGMFIMYVYHVLLFLVVMLFI